MVHGVNILPSNNASQLCVVEELYNIQNATGTLSADKVLSLFPEVITEGLPVLNLPQNVTCNNCTKEVYNIVITETPQVITSGGNSTLSKQCGADFLGLPPSFIRLLSIIESCLQMAKTPRIFRRLQRVVALPKQMEIIISHRGHSCSGIYLHTLGSRSFWRRFCEDLHWIHAQGQIKGLTTGASV